MNLEEIDKLLADWKKKIDLVSQNLIDLHGLPTYQRLAGVSGFSKVQLTGVTQARVTSALEAMNDLFGYFDLLVKTINQAAEIRASIPRFLGSPQKLQEIEQILTKPSIQLAVVHTPLANRGLLTAAQTTNAIAPQKLLVLMMNAYDAAKQVVLAVDEAWCRLQPLLSYTEDEIHKLQTLANFLKINSLQELPVIREKISSLRLDIERDPLGVRADFAKEIYPQIAQIKLFLQQAAKQQDLLRKNFAIAHQLQSQLLELHSNATAAFDESTLKVIEHSMLQKPLAIEEIEALSSWLRRLETKFVEGSVKPVEVGLENWTIKAKQYIASVEAVYLANKAPLDTRAELRGRLEALKAKALARGRVEDTILSELASQAHQLLYTRPTPLNKAAELVSQYEKRLNGYLPPYSHKC
ncbi:hypothetical protein G7B40_000800 [Aetokthonos hydrillicola Thurmond2011]|jgi:hypothetical protein|uniref:Uncharacterized protein n=1 Tax=Aetokthonos hydrillicola Thurmond2011 TaxID=2712845 RepID=A0AAP5I3I4_9CYAN|nr:hypothetical protein [Aetokthonos hydrillicola]MBO3460520.1 hypothetical protein [Aetokthonos hydrillicola CCALA 1050]MBW4588192.1 hypothetical protein [Aetokthonos hydrillicola CCALA 1050]MDR9893124.1 hypothetical protein [Aetokthonos hydrillicola Thurmond2011]